MNKIFKFFEGQIEIEEPGCLDLWWEEEEVQAALIRAGEQLRQQQSQTVQNVSLNFNESRINL